MKNKIYLLTFLIAVSILLISIGCGGGNDGITQPTSLTNTNPTNDNNISSNIAYVVVNVKWPEKGKEGSLSISSEGSEDTLTVSMPQITTGIRVKVIERLDTTNVLGSAWLADPNTTATIPIDLKDPNDPNNPLNDPNNPDILPIIGVIVRAEAYNTNDPNQAIDNTNLLSAVEEEIQLQFGLNPVDLSLKTLYFWTCTYEYPNDGYIKKYDMLGNELASFSSGAACPYGFDIDSEGNFYIANGCEDEGVKKYDPNGVWLETTGSDPVWDVCVDSEDNVYHCVRDDYQIRKYGSDGSFIEWGVEGDGNGQFNSPHGIDCDIWFKVTEETITNLSTTDIDTDKLVGLVETKFSENRLNDELTALNFSIGEVEIIFNYVDSGNDIYVADLWNHRIQKFDSDGNFILKWGRDGTGDGEFNQPRGLIVDKKNNYVYVPDSYPTDYIQKFNSEGGFITKFAINEINSCTRLGVDPLGNVYGKWYYRYQDTNGNWISEPKVRKFSPAGDTFQLQETFSIDMASKIIFVEEEE